jgi:1,4-dihydroxy-2-naphthoate octaprenyltransferase
LFAGGFLGTVLFGISYYVQALSIDVQRSILVSLPHLILIGMILTVNNTCDRKADTIAGRRTLSIVLSKESNHLLMRFMVIISFFLPILYAIFNLVPLATIPCMIVAFIPAWRTYRQMKIRGFSLETKGPSMASVSRIFLMYCSAFFLAMLGSLVM